MDAEIEVWRKVPGFNYKASNLGRIRRTTIIQASNFGPSKEVDGDLIKPILHHHGYLIITASQNGIQYQKAVHQFVMLAFVGEPGLGQQVRHLDGNKSNCKLSNLKYGSAFENSQDREKHGTTARGQRNGNCKLTDAQVVVIKELKAEGLSYKEIAPHFNVTPEMVSYICRGLFRKEL